MTSTQRFDAATAAIAAAMANPAVRATCSESWLSSDDCGALETRQFGSARKDAPPVPPGYVGIPAGGGERGAYSVTLYVVVPEELDGPLSGTYWAVRDLLDALQRAGRADTPSGTRP